MLLDVYKIIPNTAVEGPENRFCIWVQGCKNIAKDVGQQILGLLMLVKNIL